MSLNNSATQIGSAIPSYVRPPKYTQGAQEFGVGSGVGINERSLDTSISTGNEVRRHRLAGDTVTSSAHCSVAGTKSTASSTLMSFFVVKIRNRGGRPEIGRNSPSVSGQELPPEIRHLQRRTGSILAIKWPQTFSFQVFAP